MDLRGKKILVTGGDGFLGRHVVRKLIERGVRKTDIFIPQFAQCDLRILKNCEQAVARRDLVIHLAGVTGNPEFHRAHPAEIYWDNLMMGVQLMEAARRERVQKFITAGSATEYPENAPLPFREEYLWIGMPEKLHLPYTAAKKMLSVQADAYRTQYGFNAVHLIFTNMYGPGEALEGNPFVIPSLIKRIWEAKKNGSAVIGVWGTGRPTRDFLYVEDAAEGVLAAAERYDKSDPVNLGSGWEVSIRELAHEIAELMKFDGKIEFDPSKPDGVMRRMLDVARAEREFGFRAETTFQEGIAKTVAWHTARDLL